MRCSDIPFRRHEVLGNSMDVMNYELFAHVCDNIPLQSHLTIDISDTDPWRLISGWSVDRPLGVIVQCGKVETNTGEI